MLVARARGVLAATCPSNLRRQMGLLALLPTLAAAQPPNPPTFERLCAIRAPATVPRGESTPQRHICGRSGSSWYMGAVAIGSRAYLAPYLANNVGVVDVPSGTFSTISTVDAGVTGNFKYVGAVAIGATVYFAPFDEDSVGVLDTASSAFSTIRLDGVNRGGQNFADGVNRGGQNYADAVAVGTIVYMAPWNQDGVGVLDTVTSMFSTIDVSTAGSSSDVVGVAGAISKYWGAAALGTRVYFAPFHRDGILVLDTTTSALSTISTSAEGRAYRGYASALVLGTNVYFSPRCENNIGVLETTSSTFSIINITQRAWPVRDCSVQAQHWFDAETPADAWITFLDNRPGPPSTSMAAIGTKIYVVPEGQHEVGVLDTVGNVFYTLTGTTTDEAYASAVAVGSNVIFVPCMGDTVGVLQTKSTTPPTNNLLVYNETRVNWAHFEELVEWGADLDGGGSGSNPTPDCSDAAAFATSPLSLPHLSPSPPSLSHLAPSQALRLTMLQVALLSAGCLLCSCTVFGGLSYHASRRMVALRRSRDRAQCDLQLITRKARPHSWGLLGTPPASLPNGPPSTSAGGPAAGDAAVRGVVVDVETAMSVTNTEAEQVLTLMGETELEWVLVNEMPGLAQQNQQKLSAPPPEAGVDEAAGLLGGVHQGAQPQGKRQRQVASDEASGGGAPQGCSSPWPSVDAPAASIEASWNAFSTSASRVLAAAHAHHTSVSGALGASASDGSVVGRPNSTAAGSTSADSGSVDGPSGQKGEMYSALPAFTPQPEKGASAWGAGCTLHACKHCKGAKVTCVDGQRPCARCVRLGLPCEETVKPVKHACTNCSRSKIKCDLDAQNDPCGRCRRFGLVCVPVEHTPSHEGRRKKRGSLTSGDGDAKVGAIGIPAPGLAPS